MLTLTFVRHGETDYNAEGRVQGRGIDSDLNARGRRQAERLAARLADHPFDAVYTSSMRRTHQTAAPLLAVRPQLAPVALEDLDEMHWGVHEGQEPSPGLRERYARYVEAWTGGAFELPVEGGESPSDVESRAVRAVDAIRGAHAEGDVLVVTHGRLLRVLLASLLPAYTLHRMQDLTHGNTALSVVEFGPEGARARVLNDTHHLDGLSA